MKLIKNKRDRYNALMEKLIVLERFRNAKKKQKKKKNRQNQKKLKKKI